MRGRHVPLPGLVAVIAWLAVLAPSETGWAAEGERRNATASAAEARPTYGPIRPDDTLWSIAARARPGRATMEETMAALLRLNPGAFVDGDPNRIRGGAILILPTEADVRGGGVARGAVMVEEGMAEEGGAPRGPQPSQLPDLGADPRVEAEALVAENAVLRAELTEAREETRALRTQVQILEREVDDLKRRLTRAETRPPSRTGDTEMPVTLIGVGALVVGGLAAVLLVLRRRGRVRSSPVTPDAGATEPALEQEAQPEEAAQPEQNAAPEEEAPPEEEFPPREVVPEPDPVSAGTFREAPEVPASEAPDEPTAASGYSPNTKLNLARAYMNMDDAETAREVLEEVLAEGDIEERAAARKLLDELGNPLPGT